LKIIKSLYTWKIQGTSKSESFKGIIVTIFGSFYTLKAKFPPARKAIYYRNPSTNNGSDYLNDKVRIMSQEQ